MGFPGPSHAGTGETRTSHKSTVPRFRAFFLARRREAVRQCEPPGARLTAGGYQTRQVGACTIACPALQLNAF